MSMIVDVAITCGLAARPMVPFHLPSRIVSVDRKIAVERHSVAHYGHVERPGRSSVIAG